jgi:hypothetical protein
MPINQGIAIVLVEQNVHSALSVASWAYVLTTGRIVAEDTAVGLLKNPDLLCADVGAKAGDYEMHIGRLEGRFWRKSGPIGRLGECPPFRAEAPIGVPRHLICLSFKGFR